MASGTNLSGMMWTPILTLRQGTFGFHSSLWKAVYVKKKHWLSSISQHHAAICRSNVTQNPISHSTVFNRMEDAPSISPSLFLCLPCFPTLSFSDSLTFALKCFQLLQSMCSLPYILSFSSLLLFFSHSPASSCSPSQPSFWMHPYSHANPLPPCSIFFVLLRVPFFVLSLPHSHMTPQSQLNL